MDDKWLTDNSFEKLEGYVCPTWLREGILVTRYSKVEDGVYWGARIHDLLVFGDTPEGAVRQLYETMKSRIAEFEKVLSHNIVS